jgi:uncharacterized protein
MHLRLTDVLDGPLAFDGPLDLDDVRDESGSPLLAAPAHLRGQAEPGARGIDLVGRLEARLRLACSRCLEPFERPLAVDFRLAVIRRGVDEPDPPDEVELTAEDADLYPVEGEQLDLGVVAGEQIYLNLPLKPVCEPACRGLCPTCGTNRNRIECGCRQEAVDPRLAPLQRLKERFGGE